MSARKENAAQMDDFGPTQRASIMGALALAGLVAFAADVSAADGFPFASSKPAVTTTRNQHVYLGRAPHICTPSGFGKTATCFLRPVSYDESPQARQRAEDR